MPNSRDALKKLMEEFKVRAAIQTKRQAEDKGKYLHELTKHEPINEADIARMRREMQFDKFKKGSADPRQFYHGTTRQKADFTAKHALDESGMPEGGIRQFDPGWRGATFVTPDAELANTMFAHQLTPSEGGHIYPVHVQVKKPFDFANKAHVDDLMRHDDVLDYAEALGLTPNRFREMVEAGDWSKLEHPPVLDALQDLGHDSVYVNEMGVKNLGIFDPDGKIKSSIGNRGTYDTTEYDLTKKDGGEVHMQAGGVLNRMKSAARNLAQNQGINVALGEDDPMAYAGGIGSLFALYHGKLNEDEIEMDRNRRLNAEMQRAGFTRNPNDINPAWKNPLPQFNPQEIIANYPNWADMPPVDKARVLKNYEDYKRMAPSGHRYGGGGGVKKQAVDLARRGILGLRGAAPVEYLPAVVQPTTKSILDAPISRRSVLQSGVGQAARHALPMGELAALGKAVSPVAHVAEVAKAVAKPIGAESIAALMSKAIGMGLDEKQAAKFVKAHIPNAEEHALLDDLHHTLANPENYEIDNDILHPGTIMKNWIGIGGGKNVPAEEYTSSLMGIRPQIRAMKREAPEHYGTLTNYARDIADSSVEDAIERGIIRNDRELEMFRTGDPKFWDLVYERD
jgi:hypothetical protein